MIDIRHIMSFDSGIHHSCKPYIGSTQEFEMLVEDLKEMEEEERIEREYKEQEMIDEAIASELPW